MARLLASGKSSVPGCGSVCLSELCADKSLRLAEDGPQTPVRDHFQTEESPKRNGDPSEVRLTIIKPSGSSGSYTTKL
jgi:hypothetical protein